MTPAQPKNPLHGVTLEAMLEQLVARHGWPELSARISIRCFSHEPSIKSSLKFLRRTEWARAAVERLYLADQSQLERNRQRNRERAARRAHAAASEGVPSAADAGDAEQGVEEETAREIEPPGDTTAAGSR
jgi:uncharacterized protein (DUF2132 family)